MKLSGIGYMIAGSLGVVFFSSAALDRFEYRMMLESGADDKFWTIVGKVENVEESVGVAKDFVLKLDSDTMTFVGGGVYPELYQFGRDTHHHLKVGDLVTLQVERERFMTQRMEAQRGRSNKVQIASLSTPTKELLRLDTYLDWRKRDSLTGLFLMPLLAFLSLVAIAFGWKYRKEQSKRVPLSLSRGARIAT